ncbi:MAG: hypothetical protein U0790_12795 [Isosphaeraceae bacterium]
MLYTDGITEAMNAGNRQFGVEQLNRVLHRLRPGRRGHARPAILDAVDGFTGGLAARRTTGPCWWPGCSDRRARIAAGRRKKSYMNTCIIVWAPPFGESRLVTLGGAHPTTVSGLIRWAEARVVPLPVYSCGPMLPDRGVATPGDVRPRPAGRERVGVRGPPGGAGPPPHPAHCVPPSPSPGEKGPVGHGPPGRTGCGTTRADQPDRRG